LEKKNAASLEYIKECLNYDPESGTLTWRHDRPDYHFKNATIKARWLGIHAGKKISCVAANGYIVFNINKIMYLAHRICFAIDNHLEIDQLPPQIDHRDNIRTNNSRSNLRAANSLLNSWNVLKASHNTSGFKGVTWSKQSDKWRSCIQVNGKQKHLGFYDSKEDAHAAYVRAANDNFGEFARAA